MGRILKRSKGLGGSDIGPILGLSKWRSAREVYLSKIGALTGDMPLTEPMEFGLLFEAPCAKRYARLTGRTITRPRKTFVHPTFKWMRGNFDYVQHDPTNPDRGPGVLEVKWLDASRYKQWTDEGVPEGYYLQVQWYLLVSGYQWATFTVMFGGNKQEHFDLPRDEAMIERLMELAIEFWRRVEQRDPPDYSFDELGQKLLRKLYPVETKGKEIILDTPEAVAKATRLFAIEQILKEREATKTELTTWFQAQMQDAEKALVPGVGTFTWRAQLSRRLDLDLLRKAHPALVDSLTKDIASRVFRKSVLKTASDEVQLTKDDMTDMIVATGVGARRIMFDE
jgi:putative phage-type endonuclease